VGWAFASPPQSGLAWLCFLFPLIEPDRRSYRIRLSEKTHAVTCAEKLDTTFGSSGTVTTSLASNASAISSLAIQSDGKIVAAGSIFSMGNAQFQAQAAVARYLAQ
jgi:hypothetical protein